MDKTTHIKASADTNTLHLPMGQLFYLLRSNGFKVKPDDYIEMLKITERFGSADIDETAKWICPIIATTETEQLRFYNIIEQYKKLESSEAGNGATIIKKKIPAWVKIALSLLLAILVAVAVYLSLPPKDIVFGEVNRERVVEKNEPLSLDAYGLLKDHPEDTAQIQIGWYFEDSSSQKGFKVSHTFKNPGNYFVKRQFSSTTLTLHKKADSLLIHVCNDLPKVSINTPATAVMVQQPVTITSNVDAGPGTVDSYQWTINFNNGTDTVITTAEPAIQKFIFSKEGDYAVECKAVVGSISAPCTATDNKIIQVLDKGLHYSTKFSSHTSSLDDTNGLKLWVSLALLLPAAGGLLYSIFKRKLKKKTTAENKAASTALTRGPYDIPFEQNDVKLIQQERDLRRTFIQMRYKAEEETLVLNVAGTIGSIIKSGGSPQLVFAPLTQQQQYLILIDRANPKSMLTRFFAYLVKSMAEEGIPVNAFYYDKNFVCYNDHFPGGLPLQKLADMHQNSTLIILGRAHELVYSVYPVIEEKFLKELMRWQNKAIITPLPVRDWAAKEKVLQEIIILVPADVMALQKLIPALREKSKPHQNLLEITDADQYTIRDVDFRDMKALQDYLGNDEAMFQWLCAICVYPRLKWEVLIEIGKAILDKYGQPENLNYSNLLKLCRISWMQQGVFPQATRLELLKLLKTDNEICARETLLHMLSYSTLIYGEKGYFFEEEKRRQQLTNQFVLHASDNNEYERYASSKERFKTLWQKDAILDVPLKKYLDKTGGDNWQTPVNDGRNSVGLSTYFNLHEVSLNRTLRLKRGLAAAFSVLLIVLWAYIGYRGGAAKLAPLIKLSEVNKAQIVPVGIKVIKNFGPCGDSLKNSFDQLNGYLEISNQKIPLAYDTKTSIASFNVPYISIAAGNGHIMFAWNNNKSVSAPLNFNNNQVPDTVTISCVNVMNGKKQPLYIRYNNVLGYTNIENELNNALANYALSALQADFTDSSRIIYYEEHQKSRADSIVQMVKQALDINVKEEFIPEKRIPEAPPILFLNIIKDTSSTDYPVTGTNEDADSYHRMGDQYITEKQYQKAIQEYTKAINLNPQDELAYYQRGLGYEMMGNADKAIADYTIAIKLDNKNVLYYYRRASAKYSLKKYTEAIPDYNKVIDMNAPEAKTQYNYSVYYRGRSYYYLKNLVSACKDFKKSGDLGIAAGKKDYTSYCEVGAGPDCNKTFYSLREALSAGTTTVCKLDLSKENISSIPKDLYAFKNLSQLNLGNTSIPQSEIMQLQKALPACKIIYTPQAQQTETDLGDIELDQKGYTNAAGQQVMQNASRLLKAQPQGKIRLTAFYTTDSESKTLTGYMNTIVNMFEKIGVNPKTQIIRQINKEQQQVQQQQQNAAAYKTLNIHVTGINLKNNSNKSSY